MFAALFFPVNNFANLCSQNTPFVSKLITKYSLSQLCSTAFYVLFIATCFGFELDVQGSVHHKYIPIYIQQDATLHSLFLETALHVSGAVSTHHQEHMQLYLQHLVLVKPLLLPAAIVEELGRSSNSSTIAAGSSNGLTSPRCCRYSCVCS